VIAIKEIYRLESRQAHRKTAPIKISRGPTHNIAYISD
jgi:hypothetical protein